MYGGYVIHTGFYKADAAPVMAADELYTGAFIGLVGMQF